jgi:hypothetical protein
MDGNGDLKTGHLGIGEDGTNSKYFGDLASRVIEDYKATLGKSSNVASSNKQMQIILGETLSNPLTKSSSL